MARSKSARFTPFQFYESKSKNGTEKGYIRLTPSQFNSDAVLDLSANAHRIFVCMKFRARGQREFIYTYENATYDASISRQTYLRVVKELIDAKLIVRIPTSAYSPSKYQFIDGWKNYTSPRRDLFSTERRQKNWENPRPQPRRKGQNASG